MCDVIRCHSFWYYISDFCCLNGVPFLVVQGFLFSNFKLGAVIVHWPSGTFRLTRSRLNIIVQVDDTAIAFQEEK